MKVNVTAGEIVFRDLGTVGTWVLIEEVLLFEKSIIKGKDR